MSTLTTSMSCLSSLLLCATLHHLELLHVTLSTSKSLLLHFRSQFELFYVDFDFIHVVYFFTSTKHVSYGTYLSHIVADSLSNSMSTLTTSMSCLSSLLLCATLHHLELLHVTLSTSKSLLLHFRSQFELFYVDFDFIHVVYFFTSTKHNVMPFHPCPT